MLSLTWPNTGVYGLNGSMVGLIGDSKRVYSKGDLPVPRSCGEPLLTHASMGDPPTPAGNRFSLLWGHCSSPVGAKKKKKVVFALQDWSLCFPQSTGRLIIKSQWPPRPYSLGVPSSFVRSPVWEDWCGIQNLHNSMRTSLVLLFSSLWVTQPEGMRFGLVVIVPLLPSHCSFFFVFGWGYLFLMNFSILLLMVVQQLVAILLLLQKMSTHPSTSSPWTGRPNNFPVCCDLHKVFSIVNEAEINAFSGIL